MSPRVAGAATLLSCLKHCGIMLAASASVLYVSVQTVRKVALHQAAGKLDMFKRFWHPRKKRSVSKAASEQSGGHIRRVKGPPVLWKELISPISGQERFAATVIIAIELILLFISFFFVAIMCVIGYTATHVLFVSIFAGLGILFTIILPATCITSEKESRSLPLLLATTLGGWQILFGKFLGILRRCLPIWLLLFAYLVLCSHAELIHPIAVLQIGIVVSWVIVFLCGTGMYFSSCFRRTTTAVVANFALALALWVIIPVILSQAGALGYHFRQYEDDFFTSYYSTNPVVQTIVVMNGTGQLYNEKGGLSQLFYEWPHHHCEEACATSCFLLICMLFYMSLGLLFAWRAKRRLRRNVF
jgi:ABC-type transport system involved in multi-copper enzyme maturation permease subunit